MKQYILISKNPSETKKSSIFLLRSSAMLVLALLPLLVWYSTSLPVTLGTALMLVISAIAIVVVPFRIKTLPISFYAVFLYVSVIWVIQNGVSIASLFPPGGDIFFVFVLSLLGCILLFDEKELTKYMKWIVYTSMVIFWFQYFMLNTTGVRYCFVPNLTGHFSYNDFSYADMRLLHMSWDWPCAFFIEKSYMGYYYLIYLCILLFGSTSKNKWLTFPVIFICVTLLFLRSGAGVIGMGLLLIVRVYIHYWRGGLGRKVLLIIAVIPMIIGSAYFYTKTEVGSSMVNRTEEFGRENSSAYSRMIAGYVIYGSLPTSAKLIGTTKEYVQATGDNSLYNISKDRFYLNGIQRILITLGIVGLILYAIFYVSVFKKGNRLSRMAIITLLVLALLESVYLNVYMVMLTAIACATSKKNATKNKISIRK